MLATEISVCAVVVAYRPTRGDVEHLLDRTLPQVSEAVVVDNGGLSPDVAARPGVTVLAAPTNLGLAAGQNLGIERALARGHSHVLLLDQDSAPHDEMVQRLLEAESAWSGRPLGAVAPSYRDHRDRADAPFVRLRLPVNELVHGVPGDLVDCSFVIGSGMLLRREVLERVGPMDAALFIDNVDLDWCFRARRAGYAVVGVPAARMDHRLGDGRRRLFPGRRGRRAVHGAGRLYFTSRNRISLYRRASTPWVWVVHDVPRFIAQVVVRLVLGPSRAQSARSIAAGVRDGVAGRLGPAPKDSR